MRRSDATGGRRRWRCCASVAGCCRGWPAMARRSAGGGTVITSRRALALVRMGAPFHPIFVHFTVALTVASLVFDALGYLAAARSLAEAGWWALAGAVVATVF